MNDIITVNGWELALLDGEQERRIGAHQQGKRLGYEEPRAFKKLVTRHREELLRYGSLPSRDTMSRGLFRGKTQVEQIVQEPMLNEAQALLMCMFADTDAAADIREEVIRVYLVVKNGATDELKRRIERQDDMLARLFARVAELDSPQVKPSEAKAITRRIRAIAHERYPNGELHQLVAFRQVENELRGRLNFGVAAGHKWTSLQRYRLADVLLALDEMAAELASVQRAKAKHAAKTCEQTVIDFPARRSS